MEKDHFGADGLANAWCRSFPLGVEGLLEAADGASYHQLCGFLQRFDGDQAGVQENILQHTLEERGFSVPAPVYQPIHFLPGDDTSLPADSNTHSTNSVLGSRRLPDTLLHEVLNHGSPVPMRQLFPASIGTSAPPRQLWSDHDHRASFQGQLQYDALGSQRSFVFNEAPGAQAGVPSIPRKFSNLASSSVFPANIGRFVQPRVVSQKVEDLSVLDRRIEKSKRVSDQAGHIIRERLRRDDMTSKFLMLESLLPPGPKRDRATIVEHSIQYLKNLHHRKNNLQQKRTNMEKGTSRALPLGPRLLVHNTMASTHRLEIDQKISKANDMEMAGSAVEKVEVHLNLPHEIVVEMTCRPHAHLQSHVFSVWERLRMDVVQCSVSQYRGLVLCSNVLQPRVIFDPPITGDDIVRALKQATIQVDR